MRKLSHGQSIFRVLTAFLLCFTTMLALSSPVRANAKGASPLAELPVQMEALIEQYQDIMEKNPISFLSWEQADTIFPHNTTVEVIDVETGQRFFVQRIYGSLHADVVPKQQQDTQILSALYGGTYSWDRRAIVVGLEGRYYAASMNGMPHGNGIEGNGYPGHFCIHFVDSKTHGGRNVCPQHQAKIHQAYEQGGQWLSFEERWHSFV